METAQSSLFLITVAWGALFNSNPKGLVYWLEYRWHDFFSDRSKAKHHDWPRNALDLGTVSSSPYIKKGRCDVKEKKKKKKVKNFSKGGRISQEKSEILGDISISQKTMVTYQLLKIFMIPLPSYNAINLQLLRWVPSTPLSLTCVFICSLCMCIFGRCRKGLALLPTSTGEKLNPQFVCILTIT